MQNIHQNEDEENTLEDLKVGLLKYETAEEFLADIRKEFGGGDEESVKVTELGKLEQEGKIMEEFVQEFRRAEEVNMRKGYWQKNLKEE